MTTERTASADRRATTHAGEGCGGQGTKRPLVAAHLHRTLRRAVAAIGIGALVLLAPPALAREPRPAPVTLAEVASRVTAPRLGNVVELLRRDAQVEIEAIDWQKSGIKRKISVSASLVRLDSVQGGGSSRASATVSAALRDARSGTLLAILEGNAQTEEQTSAARAAERGALAGAVRGAITAIPEAMKRVR